jgi:hypothetical protein
MTMPNALRLVTAICIRSCGSPHHNKPTQIGQDAGSRVASCQWRSGFRQSRAFLMPPAGNEMIIHHADRLAKGIDDSRPAECEAAAFQILRQLDG